MTSPFDELMREVMADAGRFGHRQHVHLTWLAVRRYGTAAAVGLISDGIQRTARYAGAPQKYNATVSRAWVELVGHHATAAGPPRGTGFAGFIERHPVLLDKRLLTRFYRPATLASEQARAGWVEPDRAPFPWAPYSLGPYSRGPVSRAGRRGHLAQTPGGTDARC